MKHLPRPPRLAESLFLVAALTAGLPAGRGQTVPVQLAPVVTVATRIPESATTVGSDIDVISGATLAREQLTTLSDALSGAPSAPVFAAGQAGAAASLFLRGANSDQTLFLVDGIRLNDANTDYNGFLGGARVFPSDFIEIALGPQSTLYGSEAVGGVVSLSTKKGVGAFQGALSAEAGSFGTIDGTLTAQGASGIWAYNVAAGGSHTDNERNNNAFDSGDLALRLDLNLAKYVTIGATVRGFVAHYGDPSDEFTDNPDDYETESNWLGTVFADVKMTQYIDSHLTIGGQDRKFDAFSPEDGPPALTEVVSRRGVIDWQNTIELTPNNHLVAGLTAETDTTSDNGFGNIDRRQDLFAFYAEDEMQPVDGLYLTGGLRRDDTDTYGPVTTGRLTAAWLGADRVLKLRGSYGTGFNAPSFLDLYGKALGYAGNPALSPEKSDGWDMGLDFYVPDNVSTVGVTWFQTDFRDLIVDNFNVDPATTENIGKARTRGVELAVKTVLAGSVQTKLAYTRLEGDDLTDETPLLRRPRYTASADLWEKINPQWSVGGGASWVGIRADVDPQTFEDIYDPAYAVVRIYAAWQAMPRLAVKLRVENLLGKQYEPVSGYPALGRGIFGGVEWKF